MSADENGQPPEEAQQPGTEADTLQNGDVEAVMPEYRSAVPTLGEISVRPATRGQIASAASVAGETDIGKAGYAFARHLLKDVLISPKLAPAQIDALDMQVLDELAPTLAKSIGVENEYQQVGGQVHPAFRLLVAYGAFLMRPLVEAAASAVRQFMSPSSPLSITLRDVAATLQLANRSLTTTRNDIVRSIQPAAGLITRASQVANQLSASVQKQMADLGEKVQRLNAAVEPILRRLGEEYVAWFTRSMDTTLRRYRWWYLPVMPRPLVMEISQMAAQGKGRSVNARICEYYRSNNCRALKDLVSGWHDVSYFASRRTIFNASLRAHMRREYQLSIPALLPHLEGIAQEFLLDLGLTNKVDWNVFSQLLGTPKSKAEAVLVESFGDALLATFFSSFHPYQQYSGTQVNRHAILHGRFVKYSSEANSLRSFLMIATLHYFLQRLLSQHSISQLKTMYDQASQEVAAARSAAKQANKSRPTTS